MRELAMISSVEQPLSRVSRKGLARLFRMFGFTTRWTDRALRILSVAGLIVLPLSVHASGLECPEAGPGAMIGDSQIRRMTTATDADLAAEIAGLISRLRAENPTASDTEITNGLVSAYCTTVAQKVDASPADKWRLMRQFDRVLMQQLAASTMPQGSVIISTVPLPPAVYQALSSQAATRGQTTADFMATILTRAAGQ